MKSKRILIFIFTILIAELICWLFILWNTSKVSATIHWSFLSLYGLPLIFCAVPSLCLSHEKHKSYSPLELLSYIFGMIWYVGCLILASIYSN